MKTEVMKKYGQLGVIQLVIGVILLVSVLLPVTLDAVAGANTSGNLDQNTENILDILALMVGVGALAYIAFGVIGGGRR